MSSRPRTILRGVRAAASRRRHSSDDDLDADDTPAAVARERTVPPDRLWEVEERYRGRFDLEPLSYGKVGDWADSVDHFGGLARASFDMKNLQRCWMVKAILGNVEPGGHLVEVGAGEPLVADVLSRLGYRVTVVDPYEGGGNGPVEYDTFRRSYPDLEFVREAFPPSTGLEEEVAAIYSISVLEHVPLEALGDLIAAATAALAPGGWSIHAIDHVLAGWGADEHLERLEAVVRASGRSVAELHDALTRLQEDPETYFVSAEAHERWRGALPYDQYPMRRIASLNVFSRRAAGIG